MRRTLVYSIFVLLAIAAQRQAQAQDWPHWRGPNFDGSAEAEDLPTFFTRDEGIAWEAPLPGPAASTPIVLGDAVFLSSTDGELGKLLAICLDRETGAERWVEEAGSGYQPGGKGEATRLYRRSNYASPSAAADGERVVFFFGNGDLVAYSHAGERQWARNLQEDYGDFCFQWTFSASPLIWKGLIYIPILQRDQPVNGLGEENAPSFLLALDAGTGEERFLSERPSDAVQESLESYATPIPYVGHGREEILLVGGDVITGHDPKTGAEIWRWGTWNPGHREAWWRVVPSPVVGAGVALACGPKGAPVTAVRLGGEGTLKDDSIAWQSEGRRSPLTTDVPTPLYYGERFYVLSDLRNSLARVNPEKGEVEWQLDLPSPFKWRASPTGADGRIWLMDHGGNVLVVDADKGTVVHTAAMGNEDDDGIRSSIAIAHGRLFVRTNASLFCVGGD